MQHLIGTIMKVVIHSTFVKGTLVEVVGVEDEESRILNVRRIGEHKSQVIPLWRGHLTTEAVIAAEILLR